MYTNKNPIEGLDYYELFDLVKKIKENKNFNTKDCHVGMKGLEFISNNPEKLDLIKSLSNLQETDIVEIKPIYDRLKLLSADDWKKIIALGEQTKSFEYKELSNIKYVSSKIIKKDTIKERGLIKCYESLKKLKKFGIKV